MSSCYKSEENRRSSSNKDGDWICPDSDQCNRCGRERPSCGSEKCNSGSSGPATEPHPSAGSKKKVGIEIGKVAAEKSRGLFSAEDWQCSKCANVNWARRHTCNLCNAPRFCEVEERTGYGGGYNDRGVVEYKEREESDDEYDEFGRRKKKSHEFRSKRSYESQSKKPARKTGSAEEDNEDDDDDDDDDNGDLSKYDLWGSDEEDNNKGDRLKQSTATRAKCSPSSRSSASYSRSRSRSPRARKDHDRSRQTYYRNKHSRSRSRSPRNKHHNSSYPRR